MADYRLSAAADDDLDRLFVYGVMNSGLEHTETYTAGLTERFGELAAAPLPYRSVDHIRKGYRRSVHRAHSIYYRVEGGEVVIVRVLGRQDPKTAVQHGLRAEQASSGTKRFRGARLQG